ncbi:MAG: nitrogen fixation protein NifQ [Pseudomonadota bacterium]|nr:nitrogen fixation protein NifQ [Pseudomonadota bacterium]
MRRRDTAAVCEAGPAQCSPANAAFLAEIAAAQRQGLTALPGGLGLDAALAQTLQQQVGGDPWTDRTGVDRLRSELLVMRQDERDNLFGLLRDHRRGTDPSELWIAVVVASACLGSRHLWRDLGLASRDRLRELLSHNFPSLVARNTRDMRWKRFFYHELCERGGGIACLAPSCDQCSSRPECFGPET